MSSNIAKAQTQAQSNSFNPTRITKDFKISTDLSNPAWQRAKPIYIKYERLPDPKAPAPVKTTVKVLYSTRYLYISFIAYDPHPEKIRAQMLGRGVVGGNDLVGVYIDTFDSNKQAVVFFVNPLGVQMDHFRNKHNVNMSYDMLWDSKGAITDSGYVAVMKIPFSSLHFPEKNIQNWYVQFFRDYPRSTFYNLTWTNVSIDNPCFYARVVQ